ncbi:TPA: nucleotidyltransferase domain-containing protein [Candidatus Bathyarchaeota archaeon]|nr:nucleotidyltransferase domain-containing protein [Candidatus Bathyarchaeota archaeon]
MDEEVRERFLHVLRESRIEHFPELIAGFSARLVERLRVQGIALHSIVLFGSVARHEERRWSDVDLLVIADFSSGLKCFEESHVDLEEPSPVAVEVHPARKEWFIDDLKHQRLTAIEALEFGVVLYDVGFWEEMLLKFAELKRLGLRYEGKRTWQLAGFR